MRRGRYFFDADFFEAAATRFEGFSLGL